MAITGKKGGFAGSDYTPQFRQTRDRTLHILHTLGYGRPDMEKHMQTEIGRLVEHMRDFSGNKGILCFNHLSTKYFATYYIMNI